MADPNIPTFFKGHETAGEVSGSQSRLWLMDRFEAEDCHLALFLPYDGRNLQNATGNFEGC
jgi:hypothetical protein